MTRGFCLRAAVRCGAGDRQGLERMCRYSRFRRWAMANAAGRAVLRLKTPWHDGTTHLSMSPLKFMHLLAALVPRNRLHLSRLSGALAATAELRAQLAREGNIESRVADLNRMVNRQTRRAAAGRK